MKEILALSDTPNAPPELLRLERPDFERGDAKFFDPTSRERYQIRPLVASDTAGGYIDQPGCWMLVVRTRSGTKLRVPVLLPLRFRKNTPANAFGAYKRLTRQQPNFERLVRACDSVQKPAA